MEKSQQTSNTDKNQNKLQQKKSPEDLTTEDMDFSKKKILGETSWFHDPSGEELEIIEE